MIAPANGAAPAADQQSLVTLISALSQVMSLFTSMQAGTMVQPGAALGPVAGGGAGDGLAQLLSPSATAFGGGATLGAGSPITTLPGTTGNVGGGGGASVTGGGGATILSSPSTAFGGALPSYFSVTAPAGIIGGGGAAPTMSTSLGGASISYFSVVDPMTGAVGATVAAPGVAAPAAPAAAAAAPAPGIPAAPGMAAQPAAPAPLAGGGGTGAAAGEPTTLGAWGGTLDPQYVQGTPQPGGLLDQLVKMASPSAMPAMNEGTWMWLTDAGGARIMAHVHGQWAQHPEQIQAAIAAGRIMVHYHGDTGTLHLHDVM